MCFHHSSLLLQEGEEKNMHAKQFKVQYSDSIIQWTSLQIGGEKKNLPSFMKQGKVRGRFNLLISGIIEN